MKRKIISALLLSLASTAQAASYTAPSVITNMTVGRDFARVKTQNISSAEGCSKSEWYILDFNGVGTPEMYSMLLAAKASSQKVHFQLIGCHLDYPKVTHVYNCENSQCTN
ncbi:hypothetical protein [Teredinibacter purpureus]|uniref:hypothetical protein n=1 Tax=Teredinibacter purpureus TaxID=2731756 RepID=UPI0005F8067E|nr:hypothetical protein [Teredinibacter purpureus]